MRKKHQPGCPCCDEVPGPCPCEEPYLVTVTWVDFSNCCAGFFNGKTFTLDQFDETTCTAFTSGTDVICTVDSLWSVRVTVSKPSGQDTFTMAVRLSAAGGSLGSAYDWTSVWECSGLPSCDFNILLDFENHDSLDETPAGRCPIDNVSLHVRRPGDTDPPSRCSTVDCHDVDCPQQFQVDLSASGQGAGCTSDVCDDLTGSYLLDFVGSSTPPPSCANADTDYCLWQFDFDPFLECSASHPVEAVQLWIGVDAAGDLDIIVGVIAGDGAINDAWKLSSPTSADCTAIANEELTDRCVTNSQIELCTSWNNPLVTAV